MLSSVWPADYLKAPKEIDRKHGNHLIVFLISPFEPKDCYNELLNFCNYVCSEIGKRFGAEIECIRADSLSKPGTIHSDIWNYIQMADAIIADVSDQNGNVMLELGVAASFRDQNKIIIIRDEESDKNFLFDISPSRHFMYKRSIFGDFLFRQRLSRALEYSLAPAPYIASELSNLSFPINIDFQVDYSNILIAPPNAHQRITDEGFEFGSFYIFRYSWITLGQLILKDIKINTQIKFSELKEQTKIGENWVGVMFRSQHFFADYGHLIYVKSDGSIRHTQPISEFAKHHEDPLIGQIRKFDISIWININLAFDKKGVSGKINDIDIDIPTSKMPFVYNAGLLRIQTYQCRACIKKLIVDK